MEQRFFDVIDWTRPWLAPVLPAADSILHAADWRAVLNAAAATAHLHNHRGMPIRFVPQATLPPNTAYEAFISATGGVPTRENLHDFLNALVWLTFPKIKIQLNALQAQELAKTTTIAHLDSAQQARHDHHRGKLRDAATIFDENAALLVTSDGALLDALRGHRWREVFLARRAEFERHCEVWLFGHALMEKLVAPYKAITAHAWPVIVGEEFFTLSAEDKRGRLDEAVAEQLASGLETADFTPLPVLGVPGWWERQDNDFYEDTTVFRPKKKPKLGG